MDRRDIVMATGMASSSPGADGPTLELAPRVLRRLEIAAEECATPEEGEIAPTPGTGSGEGNAVAAAAAAAEAAAAARAWPSSAVGGDVAGRRAPPVGRATWRRAGLVG